MDRSKADTKLLDSPRNCQFTIDADIMYLSGELTFHSAEKFQDNAIAGISTSGLKDVKINIDNLQDIDSLGVTILSYLERKLEQSGIKTTIVGGSDVVRKKIDLFLAIRPLSKKQVERYGFFEKLGNKAYKLFREYVYEFLILSADLFFWSFADVIRKNVRRKGETVNQAVIIGVNAALIVVFMSFVIGLVMALHAAYQLRTFGANIFIVDLIVIAMMSQMGPLITAILVAGRSGSAIAAEIATMKVTSELDALTTMGLNPIRFVVVPKLYAALVTMPFLVILASVSGITGGAVAANVYLDISPEMFVHRMELVVHTKDLITGLVKSQVYAYLIVITGSFYGFRVLRGAEGVGKATTSAVVVTISLVILADSIMGLMFY